MEYFVWTLAMFCLFGVFQTELFLFCPRNNTHGVRRCQKSSEAHNPKLKKKEESILCEQPLNVDILLCLWYICCSETTKSWRLNTDTLEEHALFYLLFLISQRVSWELETYFFVKLHHNICPLNFSMFHVCIQTSRHKLASNWGLSGKCLVTHFA